VEQSELNATQYTLHAINLQGKGPYAQGRNFSPKADGADEGWI
jgi:hypothetical protein